jgi:hypothetical protein
MLHRYSSAIKPIVLRSRNPRCVEEFTMKRILSALIASVALFAAVSGSANAAAPAKCNGPASYCNVFFGQ